MSALGGIRVLLVEDEPIIAMTAEDMLQSLGCTIAGCAQTLAEALAAARRGGFDVAMLDINLNGEASLPVADYLKSVGLPFIFSTGYGIEGCGPHRDVPLVTKPYRTIDLDQALARALGR